jgi:hypothetical protein
MTTPDGSTLSGSTNVTYSCTPDCSSFYSIDAVLYSGDTLLGYVGSDYDPLGGSLAIDLGWVSPGDYTLELEVYDVAYNYYTDSISITVP